MAYAKRFVADVEFSCEDATRSDIAVPGRGRTRRRRGRRDHASTCRTRSATRSPTSTPRCSREIVELVPELAGVTLSVHCHDDLGLAVANSLAAHRGGRAPGRVHDQRHRRARRQRGARGDRHGAAHACAQVRPDDRHRRRGDRAHRRAWSAPSRATWCSRTRPSWGATRSPTRPASTRTACSRTAAPTRSWTRSPSGCTRSEIVLGKHSGRARAAPGASRSSGYEVDGDELKAAFVRFKEIADRKKQISALDLEAIAGRPHPRARGPVPPGLARDLDAHRPLGLGAGRGRRGRGRRAAAPAPPRATARSTRPSAPSQAAIKAGVELREYDVARRDGRRRTRSARCACIVVDAGDAAPSPARPSATDIAEASVQAFLRACSHARAAAENPEHPSATWMEHRCDRTAPHRHPARRRHRPRGHRGRGPRPGGRRPRPSASRIELASSRSAAPPSTPRATRSRPRRATALPAADAVLQGRRRRAAVGRRLGAARAGPARAARRARRATPTCGRSARWTRRPRQPAAARARRGHRPA